MILFLTTLTFSIGCALGIYFSLAPPIFFIIPVLLSVILLIYFFKKITKLIFIFLSCLIIGFIFSHVYLAKITQWHLPENKVDQVALILGEINSVPVTQWNQTRFVFLIQKFDGKKISAKVILSAAGLSQYKVGEIWQFSVRLENPKKKRFLNGFDYSHWLFLHGIRAVGFIQSDMTKNKLLGISKNYFLSEMRENIHDLIINSISNHSIAAFISAISVGLRGDMQQSDWKIYQKTGTNHLIAIAGLHIGFIAAAIYFLIDQLWRFFPKLLLRMPASVAAQIASVIGALGYTLLSGFALPAERASIMMICFMLTAWFYRNSSIWDRLWLAMLIIIALNPAELFFASIYLSFMAVALLSFVYSGRLQQPGHLKSLLPMQIVLGLGLLPMTMWFFQEASFVSFLANLIAIPWVGFFVLPLACLGSLFYVCHCMVISKGLFWLSGYCLYPLWEILKNMAYWHNSGLQHAISSPLILLLSLFGVFLLLLPRGFPVKWLGFVGFLPIIFTHVIQ